MSTTTITPNETKFRELILYVASRSMDDPKFGATKLNKLLFIIDHYAYAQLGRPVTGLDYMKLEQGPVPRRLLPIKQAMVDAKEIAEVEQPYYGREQRRLVPLRPPKLTSFLPDEISLIDDIIQKCLPMSATDISNMTHQWRGWRIAAERELIPYSAFFLSDEPPTEYERARVQELKARHGWVV
jgi:hypothetical protein